MGGCPICLAEEKQQLKDMNIFLQYKSDCWRNTAIELFDAILSKDEKLIEDSLEKFKQVKILFNYQSI